jgi:TonB family protein
VNRNKWIAFSFVCIALLAFGSTAVAQVRIDLKPEDRVRQEDRYRVPEANLPCSPDEAAWWKSLREAGDAVRSSRGDKKSAKEFVELISEGMSKSYLPPVEDRKPVILSKAPPAYTKEARQRRIAGTIIMNIELLPDGSVGEVKLRNSLGGGLDETASEAARKTVFLPAVKDRNFVSYKIIMEMNFNLY